MAIQIRNNHSSAQAQPFERNEVGQPTFALTINGKSVRAYEGQTILSVAVENGILDIPTLCDDEKLEPTSACRMCLVEIEGAERPLPSCNTPAAPGMVVTPARNRSSASFLVIGTWLVGARSGSITAISTPAPTSAA